MRHDTRLRAAAKAIYDEVYPSNDWSPLAFEEAERFGTIHYRQAVGAVQRAKAVLSDDEVQLLLASVLRPAGKGSDH